MTDRIPFNDLGRMSPDLLAEVEAASSRVIRSGWYVMGPEHDAFEAELSAYLGGPEVVATANGTDALQLALAAVGVRAGDEVLTVANAGGYTTIAARALGAVPVYADVEDETMLMSDATVREALERTNPKAIVATHLYGAMVDVPSVLGVAGDIPVVEDVAQAIGASWKGTKAGRFGAIATLSFYPTKNLGALGDGGAVATDDPELAAAVRRMRQYGWVEKYRIGADLGMNSRMDELQAAILRVRLPHLDAWNERRRAIHRQYEAATSRLVNSASESFVAHLAVIDLDDRHGVRAALDEAGINTDIHYPLPDHLQEFPSRRPAAVSLPATERAAGAVLSLPMFPELTDAEVARVAAALAEVAP